MDHHDTGKIEIPIKEYVDSKFKYFEAKIDIRMPQKVLLLEHQVGGLSEKIILLDQRIEENDKNDLKMEKDLDRSLKQYNKDIQALINNQENRISDLEKTNFILKWLGTILTAAVIFMMTNFLSNFF